MATNKRQQLEIVLVTALAKGATVAQAAAQAGVSERTVYRRHHQPGFQARIDALQHEMLQRVATVLTKAAEEGIRSLVSLQEKSTPASVRRAAARDILEVGLHMRQAAELERRLLALETGASDALEAKEASASQAGAPPVRRSGKRRRGDSMLQAALAGGDSVTQAAAKAKLSERTVYRRLHEPDFQRGVEALRADMVQRAAALLITAALLATKTLIDLQDATIPASVRRGASRDILELGRKLRQSVFLERRLEALEQQLQDSPSPLSP